MKYLLQIDGTEREKWQTISAETPQDAIVEAIRPLIDKGQSPTQAYVAETEHRHPNGTPICVRGYKLEVNRNPQTISA